MVNEMDFLKDRTDYHQVICLRCLLLLRIFALSNTCLVKSKLLTGWSARSLCFLVLRCPQWSCDPDTQLPADATITSRNGCVSKKVTTSQFLVWDVEHISFFTTFPKIHILRTQCLRLFLVGELPILGGQIVIWFCVFGWYIATSRQSVPALSKGQHRIPICMPEINNHQRHILCRWFATLRWVGFYVLLATQDGNPFFPRMLCGKFREKPSSQRSVTIW